jgi:hypothetical protein
MNEWRCFSSQNLVDWQEHPVPLRAHDFRWSKGRAYASCVVHANNKFYWYASVSDGEMSGNSIAVAFSDTPTGPFTDARGSALISQKDLGSRGGHNFDPSVLVDSDGQAYIFWGKNRCYYAKLKPSMIELDGSIHSVNLPDFTEGAHIFKKKDQYYLAYGFGFPEKVAYAMSRDIHGPWQFKGILNEIAGNCETNRPACLNFKGKDYFFYHNGALKDGGSHRRSVCLDRLYYNADGTLKRVIMTTEGISADHLVSERKSLVL